MKIIYVNSSKQDENTLDPQLIDGQIFYWNVQPEMLKTGESFQQWWARKQDYMTRHSKGKKLVDGIFLYDIETLACGDKSSMMIHYQWIKNI
jgi:hypothetical protein